MSVLNCICVAYGMGSPQYLQGASDATTTAWLSYALRLIYQVVLGTTKLGICMFYLRVFQDRKSQILIFSMMGFLCLFTIPLEIYVAVSCREADPLVSNSLTCIHNTSDIYLFAIFSIVSDAMLVIFVIPRIRESPIQMALIRRLLLTHKVPLQLEFKQKAALIAVLCLGLLVITAAIARLIEVTQFNDGLDHTRECFVTLLRLCVSWYIFPELRRTITVNSFRITTWSAIEVDTGLFCASAPALKPLIRKWSNGSWSSSSYTRSNMPQGQQDHEVVRSRGDMYHGSPQAEDGYEMSSQECLQTPGSDFHMKSDS